jgi:hypothetical protein
MSLYFDYFHLILCRVRLPVFTALALAVVPVSARRFRSRWLDSAVFSQHHTKLHYLESDGEGFHHSEVTEH